MAKSSNYWDKRALQRLSDVEKNSEAYIRRIKKIYEQAYKDINNELIRVYDNYSKETGLDVQKLKELLSKKETDKVWKTLKRQGFDKYIKDNYKSRISRLEQIQAQIYGKAKLIYNKEELEQTMCYKGVINDSYYKAIYDTQMGTGYDFGFNRIDNNVTTALLNEKWSGKNYSERIWGNTDILAENISQIIGGAILSGQSIARTSKQIRDRFNVGKYYSERLVRTETNYFNNKADAMAYEEMGIDKYVFVATLDKRTSPMCQEMDNKVFKYKDISVGENYPPLHPNCRSKTRGYLGEEAEKNLIRRARNPVTGKNEVIDNISYKEWAKQHGLIKEESASTKVAKNSTNKPKNDIINNKNYNCDLAKKFGNDYYDELHNRVVNTSDKNVAKVWKKYESGIEVGNPNYGGRAHCSGKTIYVNKSKEITGSRGKKSYQTTFHEGGHAIDYLANNHSSVNNSTVGTIHFSSKYKDGLFPQTIIDEVNDWISKVDMTLKQEFKKHSNDVEWFKDNGYISQYLYDAYKQSNSTSSIIPKYRKAYAYYSIQQEINKLPDIQKASISDILEGATGGKINCGWGHGKSYWKDRTIGGVSDGLATEAFAEMIDGSIANVESIDTIKKYLPKSHKVFEEMIEVLSK